MVKLSTWAEKFLWNNLKMYLMQYQTCLCDNILKIKNEKADFPIDRYDNFMISLDNHIGLGSYTLQQPTQYSNLPYVNARFQPYDLGSCSTRVTVVFDVVFATDLPKANDNQSKYAGNSSEAVAAFRANIISALDELMFNAYDKVAYPDGLTQAYFDRLRNQTLPNPVDTSQTTAWKYNVVGQVDAETTISEVVQLKTEDRNSGLSVFQVVYRLDLNKIYGDGIDCQC